MTPAWVLKHCEKLRAMTSASNLDERAWRVECLAPWLVELEDAASEAIFAADRAAQERSR